MEMAIMELECSLENVTLKSLSSVNFLFKRNRKQMEQGGPTCHRTPQALASTLFLRSYRGVTKSSWSYYSLGAPHARTLPESWSLEQVASILGLCSASNIRPKLLTRSTGTQGSHQKSSAEEPERGQGSRAGKLSAMEKRGLARGKEASKELSNMKERLLPKESIAICSKSWTRNFNLDLQRRYTEVRRAIINEVQGARGVKLWSLSV